MDSKRLASKGLVTCKKVLAPGALVLNCTDNTGKRIMLITAAVEYQKDPATPFCTQSKAMSSGSGGRELVSRITS